MTTENPHDQIKEAILDEVFDELRSAELIFDFRDRVLATPRAEAALHDVLRRAETRIKARVNNLNPGS